ncbi:MAG: SPFH domain-containing protein [Planctomycetota bacterium]|jgi:regulator of protease activity HflC (stomatin/prohibitin superfamily)
MPENSEKQVDTRFGARSVSSPMIDMRTDPASQSLADALRVSFRVLTVIMIFVVIAFLLSGFKSIEPQQVGIKMVFGHVVGTAEQGLAYTWPFPVGRIDLVDTSERTLSVEDFWMHETPSEKLSPLHQRGASILGLRPGYDGALLTGDRNLLHVKMVCKYVVQGTKGALVLKRNIDDLEETIRSLVCKAAILAAARRTADGIQRSEKGVFSEEVRREAQRRLNQLTRLEGRTYESVRINTIIMEQSTWPLLALPAYLKAQKAISEQAELRNQAIADARKILNEAAGANHAILVGRPEELVGDEELPAKKESTELTYDLIGQYTDQIDPARGGQILRQIDEVLIGPAIGGLASEIIAEARAYRTQVIQEAESRAKRFDDLLEEFEKTPQFMLERHWADVREEILNSPTIEKFYITLGDGKTVLRISRDPEVRKEIQREILKLERQQEASPPSRSVPSAELPSAM